MMMNMVELVVGKNGRFRYRACLTDLFDSHHSANVLDLRGLVVNLELIRSYRVLHELFPAFSTVYIAYVVPQQNTQFYRTFYTILS